MRYIIFLLSMVILISCGGKNEIEKPNKLIEREVMEKILYDLALMQAIRGYAPEEFHKNNIEPKTYIYQKYKIDSVQFAENNRYYSADIEDYKKMFQNVSEKLQKEKTALDTILKRKERTKSKKTRDSLIKISNKQNSQAIKKLNVKEIK